MRGHFYIDITKGGRLSPLHISKQMQAACPAIV